MSLNKVILIGRLANDPESKVVDNAENTTFRLAVTRNYTLKGKDKPEVDFIPVSLWRGNAKFAFNYYTQGCQVYVVGSLENYSYDTENGKVFGYRINGTETGFAGGKKTDGNEKKDDAPKTADNQMQSMENMGFTPMPMDFNDDLPFNMS